MLSIHQLGYISIDNFFLTVRVPAQVVCYHWCCFDLNLHVTPVRIIVISFVVDHGSGDDDGSDGVGGVGSDGGDGGGGGCVVVMVVVLVVVMVVVLVVW